jgi:uncharacterized membrane protein
MLTFIRTDPGRLRRALVAAAAVVSFAVAAPAGLADRRTEPAEPRDGAELFELIPFDIPVPSVENYPIGINDRGDVAGVYRGLDGRWHGYVVWRHGAFEPIEVPGATGTVPIDVRNDGTISGTFFDADGFQHGFLLRREVYTSLDVPGAAQTTGIVFEFGEGLGTAAYGMNEAGAIVGEYASADGVGHGWMRRGRHFVTIDHPAAAPFPGFGTTAFAVSNDGTVVGRYWAVEPPYGHGFLFRNGRFTEVAVPGSGGSFGIQTNGINARGEIVGTYTTPDEVYHGLLRHGGRVWRIDYPGAAGTEVHFINERGDITGAYWNADWETTGLVYGIIGRRRGGRR